MYAPEVIEQSRILGLALQQHLPTLFNFKEPVPLALGIHNQIIADFPDAPAEVVQAFLGFWTRRTAYLKAMAAKDSQRIDTIGDMQPVSDQHRADAKRQLKIRYAKQKAARAAQAEALTH